MALLNRDPFRQGDSWELSECREGDIRDSRIFISSMLDWGYDRNRDVNLRSAIRLAHDRRRQSIFGEGFH